jgi:hypothetical protein
MVESSDPLQKVHARRLLEEINHFILHHDGEILEAPGKLSLVWYAENREQQRFISLKPAGENELYINGRRYPAMEQEVKKGLLAALSDYR